MLKKILSLIAVLALVFSCAALAETVEIALEAENAPYTYEDDDGNPAGYEYDVLLAIDE